MLNKSKEATTIAYISVDMPDSRMSTNSMEVTNVNSRTWLRWIVASVWPLMSTLPLLLSSSEILPTHYSKVFPQKWYTRHSMTEQPKPLGLILGITAVAVGHIFLLPLFYMYRKGWFTRGKEPPSIQTQGARRYDFREGLTTHLSQPEGFVLLTLYLSVTWLFNGMPKMYYSFDGTIQWDKVFWCLVIQDGLQYLMHRIEHSISPEFYKKSHKPHHRFTNPRLFDAFNGSVSDTILMILIPLYTTANIVRDCNVWTYMAFGSMYANWLVLIHSEYCFPWDSGFQSLGLGTCADHHVHHAVFKYNYGHLFMWFDQIAGTYKSPKTLAPKLFNEIQF